MRCDFRNKSITNVSQRVVSGNLPLVTQSHTKAQQTLRQRRIEQGLTLRELVYFAGCSHGTISRLEHGTLDVAPALKARIAKALRVPVAELWAPENGETLP